MSTTAPETGAHAALVLTTLTARLSCSPDFPSRMSLRTKSCSDGYGPIVSVGDTAHAAAVPVGGTVVVVGDVVVAADAVVVGLVGVPSLQAAVESAAPAAPSIPSA